MLVGGCFDVLHPGHVIFLEKAKKAGDKLVVLLESDEKVRQLKGSNRPVHNQKERARVLSALKSVDQVILLPEIKDDHAYDEIILKIRPDIIAITKGYSNFVYHQRAAKVAGAKLRSVTQMVGNYSTSRILDR